MPTKVREVYTGDECQVAIETHLELSVYLRAGDKHGYCTLRPVYGTKALVKQDISGFY